MGQDSAWPLPVTPPGQAETVNVTRAPPLTDFPKQHVRELEAPLGYKWTCSFVHL